MKELLLMGTAAAALAGCSPYRLAPNVNSFSAAIAQAHGAMDDGLVNIRGDLVSQRSTRAAFMRGPLNVPGQCGTGRLKDAAGRFFPPCVATAATDREPIVADVFQEADEKRRQIAALSRYAAALAAVTDARDSRALSEATNSLAGAALALATATGMPEALAVPAAVGFVGTSARIALDAERMAVLRRTVRLADPAVAKVATAMATYLASIRDERLRIRNEDDRFRGDQIANARPGDRAARIAVLQDRLAVADALRGADARATAEAIKNAHAKLKAAADDPAANAASLVVAVEELTDQVKKLRAGLAAQSRQSG